MQANNITRRAGSRRLLAVFCLLLMLVLSGAQAAHDHANDAKAALHCSVCIAAHASAVSTTFVVAVPVLLKQVAGAPARAAVTSLLFTENSYIRPPPAA